MYSSDSIWGRVASVGLLVMTAALWWFAVSNAVTSVAEVAIRGIQTIGVPAE